MYRSKVHMSEFSVLNNRHATTPHNQRQTQQHTSQHTTPKRRTHHTCLQQTVLQRHSLHKRNTTPLPPVCWMRATLHTGNMPRLIHSGPWCGALPLPLPLRCGVVVLWLYGFVVVCIGLLWWCELVVCVLCVVCCVRMCVLVVFVFMGRVCLSCHSAHVSVDPTLAGRVMLD